MCHPACHALTGFGALTCSALLVGAVDLRAAGADELRFNRDIRPILSDNCFQCHGPDSAQRKADLRLDVEASAKRDVDGIRPIVAGQSSQSDLIRRITSDDPDVRMPPPTSGKQLNAAQIERLTRWIDEGAKWQRHWAFISPERPRPPKAHLAGWVRNPIDAFVLARLEAEGLTHSPEADRATLIRRVALDLIGLPPTPEEVDAFVADESPDAYERLVDRLLASPRYGERMAARWLDAARYADTSGYQDDGARTMWRWRDWVIEAYNRNLPFDQFTIEQLAGDLLPRATLDQQIATGFNRNHRANAEGGIIPEEYAVEYVVDRIDTTATVWLGLTMACARCHDHKFDPVSQREFYQFFAFFNNVPEKGRAVKVGNSPPMIKAPTRDQQQALAAIERRLAEAERASARLEGELAAGEIAWCKTPAAADEPDWAPSESLAAHFPLDAKPAEKVPALRTILRASLLSSAASSARRSSWTARPASTTRMPADSATTTSSRWPPGFAPRTTPARCCRGWSPTPTPRAIACNWPAASCRPISSSAGSTMPCASKPRSRWPRAVGSTWRSATTARASPPACESMSMASRRRSTFCSTS